MKTVPIEKIEELVRKWRDRKNSSWAAYGPRLNDADELSALAASAVDVHVEAQDRSLRDPQRLWDLVRYMRMELIEKELVTDDEYAELVQDHASVARLEADDRKRIEAQGKPDARPAIGPNTYRGEDGSVSVLGTSTGVPVRPVTDEQKREMVDEVWRIGGQYGYHITKYHAEEIVTHILNRLAPSTGKPTPSEEKR